MCVKIIKNNKDFFDQSLDEIKLLKYVNKHDPADKYHLLRLYDYFYYRVSMSFFNLFLIPSWPYLVPMEHVLFSSLGLRYMFPLILLKHFPYFFY